MRETLRCTSGYRITLGCEIIAHKGNRHQRILEEMESHSQRGPPIKMSGYTPTHIGIPKNHADFERNSVVLFQQVLGDPGVKRLGRSGQRQYGIDLLGYRDGNLKKLVGIQCKKKQPNKALTTTEVRTEVRKALKYNPRLTEYIIVTTAPDDTKLDKLATLLTKQQRDKGRKIKI